MLKNSYIISFLLLISSTLRAQVYQPVAASTDAFSVALVKLLQSATNNFNDVKGKYFQLSFLSQHENYLDIKIPGSIAGIIRERSPGQPEVYLEFGGIKDSNAIFPAVKDLVSKIRKALGKQLLTEDLDARMLKYHRTGFELNFHDDSGWFQSNMEILVGSDTSASYLYKTTLEILEEKKSSQVAGKERTFFILLKLAAGKPEYYYNIPASFVLKTDFDKTIRSLLEDAKNDFEKFFSAKGILKKNNVPSKRYFLTGK